MDDQIDKNAALQMISDKTSEIELAIESHPHEILALYRKGLDALLEGQSMSTESEWSRSTGLPMEELAIVQRYLFASAFMTAWFHLNGDKASRDKGTHAASILAWGAGIDPETALKIHVKYEVTWVQAMKAQNLKPKSGCLGMLLALALAFSFLCRL